MKTTYIRAVGKAATVHCLDVCEAQTAGNPNQSEIQEQKCVAHIRDGWLLFMF